MAVGAAGRRRRRAGHHHVEPGRPAPLTDLTEAKLAEISAGKLAQDKAQNPDAKAYAQQMVDKHGRGQVLQQVTQNKSVTLPTEPDSQHQ